MVQTTLPEITTAPFAWTSSTGNLRKACIRQARQAWFARLARFGAERGRSKKLRSCPTLAFRSPPLRQVSPLPTCLEVFTIHKTALSRNVFVTGSIWIRLCLSSTTLHRQSPTPRTVLGVLGWYSPFSTQTIVHGSDPRSLASAIYYRMHSRDPGLRHYAVVIGPA